MFICGVRSCAGTETVEIQIQMGMAEYDQGVFFTKLSGGTNESSLGEKWRQDVVMESI
jgi:hypothetical protein